MKQQIRILFVEDVPSDAELISRELDRGGLPHVSIRVENRENFVRAIQGFSPDAILSDYSLPAFDGMSALRLAKQMIPAVPFIIITGSLNEETAVECMKAGAADYILKDRLGRLGPALEGALESAQIVLAKANAEAELVTQAMHLKRMNSELEQFAFVTSHDLREPLRKIVLLGDRLATHLDGIIDEKGREYLRRLQGAAIWLETLVESLSHYARVTGDAQGFEDVDLNVTVRETLSDLEQQISRQKDLEINVGELGRVKGNPRQLRELLKNLVENAIKFRRRDAASRVSIGSRKRDDKTIEITVTDNGIGFDPKYIDCIFLPFQQLQGRGQSEGTGLGLTICQRVAQCNGGSISVKSSPGKGATFTVCLPAAAEPAPVSQSCP